MPPTRFVEAAALVAGFPALLLGSGMARRALTQVLDDLPAIARRQVEDALEACHHAGQAWRRQAERKSEGLTTTPAGESNHEHATGTTHVAQILGVSGRRVRQLAEAGQIPAHRHGHRWSFDVAAIMAIAEERRTHGTET